MTSKNGGYHHSHVVILVILFFNYFSSLHTLNRPSVWISEGSCEFNFTDKLRWVDGRGSSKIIRIPVPSNYKIKRKSSLVVRQWPSFKSTQSKDIVMVSLKMKYPELEYWKRWYFHSDDDIENDDILRVMMMLKMMIF